MKTIKFTEEKWEAIRNHLELTEDSDYSLVRSYAELSQAAIDGEINPLAVMVDMKIDMDQLSEAIKKVQPLAIEAASKYAEKSFKFHGAIIEKKNNPARWDYSQCAAYSQAEERLKYIATIAQAGGGATTEGEWVDKAVRLEGASNIAVKLLKQES